MSDGGSVLQRANRWVLPLQERKVSRCYIDFAFGIEFLEGSRYEIRIGGKFRVIEQDATHDLSPEDPTRLGPALAVLHSVVADALAYDDGHLEVSFVDGLRLIVDVDMMYEAWEVNGDDGLKVVSLPGGKLSVWKPTA